MKTKLLTLNKAAIALLISVLLLLAASQTVKADIEGDFAYVLTNGQATITGYSGVGGDVTIPATLGSCPVIAIGEKAFYQCNSLTSVSIPNGVTSIGSLAFAGTSLSSITIPNSVTTIGYAAFQGCSSLSSITLPTGLTTTGDYAFMFCTSLSDITIPNSVTSIGLGTFWSCSSLSSITIPKSVTTIGNYSFAYCSSLSSITIPNSVTSIGDSAFYGCRSLSSITFLDLTPPTTGTGWTENADPTLLGHAYYGSSFPAPGSSFNGLMMGNYIPEDYTYTITNGEATITGYHGVGGDVTIPATLGGCPVVAIGDSAFYWCTSLTTVRIPDSVTSLGDYAFYDCISLTNVTIPNSVTTIGNYTFAQCNRLSSISIPYSITTIGDYAFYSCRSLTNIDIPNSVTTIGAYAFYYCTSLTSVTIPNSITSIGYGAFYRCSSLPAINVDAENPNYTDQQGVLFDKTGTTLIQYPAGKPDASYTIPNPVTAIEPQAFAWSPVSSITIPDNLTDIDNYAFYACHSLTSITIPNSVTTIGNYSFSGCSSLSSITLPNSITSIGSYAFYSCNSLKSISIPNSVTNVNNDTFAYCYSMSSITIPKGVTTISSGAFSFCSALTSITIPNSVTYIGNYAFLYCSSLTNITFLGVTPPTVETSGVPNPLIGSGGWIANTNSSLLGHAYYGSSFPAPGSKFYNLTMGDYITDITPPSITSVAPPSPTTIYTRGTNASQTFSATYSDNFAVASINATLDGTPITGLTVSGLFSYDATLPVGTHTLILTVLDYAGNMAQQTWTIKVSKDAAAPKLSGIHNNDKVTYGVPLPVTLSDSQSGVDFASLKVTIDGQDQTSKLLITNTGFTIPSQQLGRGTHTIEITVADNAGNSISASYNVRVQ